MGGSFDPFLKLFEKTTIDYDIFAKVSELINYQVAHDEQYYRYQYLVFYLPCNGLIRVEYQSL